LVYLNTYRKLSLKIELSM